MKALQLVAFLLPAAIACDAHAKDIPVATGPVALDTAAVVLRLPTPYRHTGDPTTLCVVVDSTRYDLRDIRRWTIHQRQPGEARSGLQLDTTPDPAAVGLSGAVITDSGQRLPLRPSGYAFGVDQRVCLGAALFTKGVVVTAVALSASRPLTAGEVAWNVIDR